MKCILCMSHMTSDSNRVTCTFGYMNLLEWDDGMERWSGLLTQIYNPHCSYLQLNSSCIILHTRAKIVGHGIQLLPEQAPNVEVAYDLEQLNAHALKARDQEKIVDTVLSAASVSAIYVS